MIEGMQAIENTDFATLTDVKRIELAEKMPIEFGKLVYEAVRLSPGHSLNLRDLALYADGKKDVKLASHNVRRYLEMRFSEGVWKVRPIGDEVVEIYRPERRQKLRYRPHGGILQPSGIENFVFQGDLREELGQLQKRVLETRDMPRDETLFGRVTVVEKAYVQTIAEALGITVSNFVRGQAIVYSTFQPDLMYAQEALMGPNSPRFELLLGRYHTHIVHALRILLRQLKGGHYIQETTRNNVIELCDHFIDMVRQTRGTLPDGPELPFAA
jgi:hypothetical protein